MATIQSKHWYRFYFLKSEEWKNIRLEALAKCDARCCICNHRSTANDVHHIWYDDLRTVEEGQLVVLCRDCHDTIHDLIDSKTCKTPQEKSEALELFNRRAEGMRRELIVKNSRCTVCGKSTPSSYDPVLKENTLPGGGFKLCFECQLRLEFELTHCPLTPTSKPAEIWNRAKFIIPILKQEHWGTKKTVDNGRQLFYSCNR